MKDIIHDDYTHKLEEALNEAAELLARTEKDFCYYCPLHQGESCIGREYENRAVSYIIDGQSVYKYYTYKDCNKEDWLNYLRRNIK